ncbi:MAG TPA: DUF1064 domain-containing protein [Spirochaetota bacterium]|nr:DUF1064 domain-containing protein [Spirochaetota bacterium]
MDKNKCTLNDQELIEKCDAWINRLCKSGGKDWSLQVPVDYNCDPDMLFVELIKRFKEKLTKHQSCKTCKYNRSDILCPEMKYCSEYENEGGNMRLIKSNKNKYKVSEKQDRTYNGKTFASKKEMNRYKHLLFLMGQKEIFGLETQPKFLLQEGFFYEGKKERAIYYIADFRYLDKNGSTIIEDVKGLKTPEYLLKRKLFLNKYGNSLIFKEV